MFYASLLYYNFYFTFHLLGGHLAEFEAGDGGGSLLVSIGPEDMARPLDAPRPRPPLPRPRAVVEAVALLTVEAVRFLGALTFISSSVTSSSSSSSSWSLSFSFSSWREAMRLWERSASIPGWSRCHSISRSILSFEMAPLRVETS